MKFIMIIILCINEIIFNASDESEINRQYSLYIPDSSPIDDVNKSDEELCDLAIQSFSSPHTLDQFSKLKPYILKVIKEERNSPIGSHGNTVQALKALCAAQNREYRDDILGIKDILLNASHDLLKDRQIQLEQRELELQEKKMKLSNSVSKRLSLVITCISSAITGAAGFLITYYNK